MPGFPQRIVNGIVGKMWPALPTADGDENDGRLITKNKNAFRRMLTA